MEALPGEVTLMASCLPSGLFAGAAIFVILFTVILITLRRAGVFPRGVNVVLAICASLLAMIGMMRTFGHAGEITRSSGSSWPDIILLPYTALGISILLVLLLLLGRATAGARERHHRSRRSFCDEYQKRGRTEDGPERPEIAAGRKEGRP